MFYNTCPDCGANLDPGEKCDCKSDFIRKEIGLPDANQNSPIISTDVKSVSTHSISQNSGNVNSNLLQKLRIEKGIQQKELVCHIQRRYPKYDKTLHSKCERGELYGIQLRADAIDDLIKTYAPEMRMRIKYIRGGCHKRNCRVMCRLDDADYEQFANQYHKDGFATAQDALEYLVKKYLIGDIL